MRICLVLLSLLISTLASAQTVTPNQPIAWDQIGQVPATANGATYRMYVDAAPASLALVTVTCSASGTADSTCAAPLPPLKVGRHTVTLTQVIDTAESPQSVPLTFSLVIVVTPTNLRIG